MARPSFALFAQQYFDAILQDFGQVFLNEPIPRDPSLRVFKIPSRSDWGNDVLRAVTQNHPNVMVSPEVVGEAEIVDILFEPTPNKSRSDLGLLGELLFDPTLIAPFRSSPTFWDLREPMRHIIRWQVEGGGGLLAMDENPRKPLETDPDDDDDPHKRSLIIVPSLHPKYLSGYGAEPSDLKIPGVYECPPAFGITIVIAHELPRDDSTLLLRLMGRGRTQREAIADLIQGDSPLRSIALRQFQQWYQLLLNGKMGKESGALMTALSELGHQ
ncbi:MAG: hypothetical protein HC860_14820 [Alkalinema sp. RU_4_3]|nr:hypothetical protein [Alkalinema sp. RU_4_3]